MCTHTNAHTHTQSSCAIVRYSDGTSSRWVVCQPVCVSDCRNQWSNGPEERKGSDILDGGCASVCTWVSVCMCVCDNSCDYNTRQMHRLPVHIPLSCHPVLKHSCCSAQYLDWTLSNIIGLCIKLISWQLISIMFAGLLANWLTDLSFWGVPVSLLHTCCRIYRNNEVLTNMVVLLKVEQVLCYVI